MINNPVWADCSRKSAGGQWHDLNLYASSNLNYHHAGGMFSARLAG
jgi:hypothetical protein